MPVVAAQVAAARAGSRKALSRLLTAIEDDLPEAREIVRAIYQPVLDAVVIGVTGVPGAGKSTFVARLVAEYRHQDQRVAVLAHDPSSAFSGGAILGDRVRMGALVADPGVYIRSVASRGSIGGVARLTRDAIRLLAATGYEVVVVETVGAGQLDLDVRKIADLNIVIVVPGTGDIVQASKAGIIEIGDLFVVNKGDFPGADLAVQELRRAVEPLAAGAATPRTDGVTAGDWAPPVLKTNSIGGEGFGEVMQAIGAFLECARRTRAFERRRRQQDDREVLDRLDRLLWMEITSGVMRKYATLVTQGAVRGDLDPYAAADTLFALVKQEIARGGA